MNAYSASLSFTVKPNSITLNSKSVRIVIAVGVAFLMWLFCFIRLDHRCALGYKWFESYSGIFVGVAAGASIIFVRRLWLGSLLSVAVFVGFFQFVIPPYLSWIHGPNHPYFPAADAQMKQVLNDLRVIEATEALKPQPATPHAPPK